MALFQAIGNLFGGGAGGDAGPAPAPGGVANEIAPVDDTWAFMTEGKTLTLTLTVPIWMISFLSPTQILSERSMAHKRTGLDFDLAKAARECRETVLEHGVLVSLDSYLDFAFPLVLCVYVIPPMVYATVVPDEPATKTNLAREFCADILRNTVLFPVYAAAHRQRTRPRLSDPAPGLLSTMRTMAKTEPFSLFHGVFLTSLVWSLDTLIQASISELGLRNFMDDLFPQPRFVGDAESAFNAKALDPSTLAPSWFLCDLALLSTSLLMYPLRVMAVRSASDPDISDGPLGLPQVVSRLYSEAGVSAFYNGYHFEVLMYLTDMGVMGLMKAFATVADIVDAARARV